MTVEMSDFQATLCLKAINTFVDALPNPKEQEGAPLNALDETIHLVRYEAANLLILLNKPIDSTPRNTFKTNS